MKYLLVCLISTVCLMACQNQSESATTNDSMTTGKHIDTTVQSNDSAKAITLQNGIYCFAYIKNHDTISMQLILKDSVVSGNLVYNFYEKDKNKGTFKGFLKSDTLLANYVFSSEGMQSVRQVIFLLKGNILLSGSGSMKEQKNRLVFSNKKDITFDDNLILKLIDCGMFKFK